MTEVLFVCLQNAGRSQMAQALFERYAPAADYALSAGTTPAEQVHSEVLEVMGELGIDLSDRRPQRLTHELLQRADVVLAIGFKVEFQYVPGKRYLDWDLPDPAGRPIEQVREIRDEIATRVKHLVRELGSLRADLPSGQAFGLLDEGVLVVGPEGVVISANPAACAMLGRTEAELRAPNFLSQLDFESTSPQLGNLGELAAAGKPVRDIMASVPKRDGSQVEVSLDCQPLSAAAGGVEGAVLSMRRRAETANGLATEERASISALTKREREVVRLIALGYPGAAIAKELCISPETVRTHVGHAMEKLGARTRAHMVALALSNEGPRSISNPAPGDAELV